jgi:predicted secreted Zn-dependent protease
MWLVRILAAFIRVAAFLFINVFKYIKKASLKQLVGSLGMTIILLASMVINAHADSLGSVTVAPPSATARPSVTAISPALKPSASPSTETASAVPAVPNCQPDTSYSMPTDITPTYAGLQVIIDTPSTYAVYGNTPAEIMSQMANCTPVDSAGTNGASGKYAASTANTIDWSVSYTDNGTGICSIASASLTLHINQVFPLWQPTSGMPSSLISDWQTFTTKLHAYEQGHVSLDEAGAQTVLNNIEQVSPTACDSINSVVSSIVSADNANTLTANANYDIANDFGNKEGIGL